MDITYDGQVIVRNDKAGTIRHTDEMLFTNRDIGQQLVAICRDGQLVDADTMERFSFWVECALWRALAHSNRTVPFRRQ